MITGAANAEAALLLIDANEGVQEQSRRHGYLLNLLGIRQIAVLVNKMDLRRLFPGALRRRLRAEFRAFLKSVGVEPKGFIPIAAKHGDNIASRSANMPWWKGPTVLETLDDFQVGRPPGQPALALPDPGRLPLRRPPHPGRARSNPARFRWATGWFSPRPTRSALSRPSNAGTRPPPSSAQRGRIHRHHPDASRFLSSAARWRRWKPPRPTNWPVQGPRLLAGHGPRFAKGRPYKLKLATQEVECEIESIEQSH